MTTFVLQSSIARILFCVLFFSFLHLHIIFAQSCFPDGIDFETQAQVDDFASQHPDCTEILGSVFIGDDVNNSPCRKSKEI